MLSGLYHMQIMEGDLIRTLRDNKEYIAHFHTGGVPGRHELDDTQEVNWRAVASAIAATGFQGYMAHEFVPTRDPLTSLREAGTAWEGLAVAGCEGRARGAAAGRLCPPRGCG